MRLRYFKRFRMEVELDRVSGAFPQLPEGYVWSPWRHNLLDRHARTKLACFRDEIDAQVFPCLSGGDGCRRLMQEIVARDTFLPGATWLISHQRPDTEDIEDCATIQGLAKRGGWGSIQNVGVSPNHRGQGLGRALVLKALDGFRRARLRHVYLEVTAENQLAVDLYRSIGFRLARTLYKAVETEASVV